jgi:F-type H+-transporting ATPase subunit epsilon
VTGGFAEVTEARCSVLADSITRQADLDPQVAAAALQKAKEDYAAFDFNDPHAYLEASDQLISAQAMVDAVNAKKPGTVNVPKANPPEGIKADKI